MKVKRLQWTHPATSTLLASLLPPTFLLAQAYEAAGDGGVDMATTLHDFG
jgi:hypothetical protein